MERKLNWLNTQPIADFLRDQGASKMQIIRSPKTGKRFFAVPGTSVTGAISDKVESLSLELTVSEVTSENGETFFLVSKPSDNNMLDELSL
jgi:hypothetical protein